MFSCSGHGQASAPQGQRCELRSAPPRDGRWGLADRGQQRYASVDTRSCPPACRARSPQWLSQSACGCHSCAPIEHLKALATQARPCTPVSRAALPWALAAAAGHTCAPGAGAVSGSSPLSPHHAKALGAASQSVTPRSPPVPDNSIVIREPGAAAKPSSLCGAAFMPLLFDLREVSTSAMPRGQH